MAAISEVKKIIIRRDCTAIENPFLIRWWHPLGLDQWLFDSRQIIGANTTSAGEVQPVFDSIGPTTTRISKPLDWGHFETVELFTDHLTTNQIKGLVSLYESTRIQRWISGDEWEDLRLRPGQAVGYDTQAKLHSFSIKLERQPTFTKIG